MAERRASPQLFTRAELRVEDWLSAVLPRLRPSAWLLQDAGGLVDQPFFVALDPEGSLCWTDDRARARRFPEKQAADRFALDRMTTDVRIVPDSAPRLPGHFVAGSTP